MRLCIPQTAIRDNTRWTKWMKAKMAPKNTQVIAPWDRFLLEYTEDSIEHMTGYAKRKLIKNLVTVQKAYTEERKTADMGQSIIRKLVDHGDSIMSGLRPLITTDRLRPNTPQQILAPKGSLPGFLLILCLEGVSDLT